MPLSSDNDANVAQLMTWLRAEDATPDAVNLREELAYLLFYGDPTWANNDDSNSISDYRSILSDWLKDDSSDESTFTQLTTPGEDAAANRDLFTTWFTPVVEKWKQAAKATESGDRGIENPNYAADPVPGTQFYWYDSHNEVYLYASTADAPDSEWLSYEDRRYTAVAYDDARRTNYRQDVITKELEFQSRTASKRWLTAAEWEEEVGDASGQAAVSEEPIFTTPVYDAGFEMYRRFNSASQEYEYAEDMGSKEWLSVDEATARRTAIIAAQQSAAQDAYQQFVAKSFEQAEQGGDPLIAIQLRRPDGRNRLHEDVMKMVAEVLAAMPPT